MKNNVLSFVYKHLYLVWGGVVVGVVSLLTGAVLAAICGTTIGICCAACVEHLIK